MKKVYLYEHLCWRFLPFILVARLFGRSVYGVEFHPKLKAKKAFVSILSALGVLWGKFLYIGYYEEVFSHHKAICHFVDIYDKHIFNDKVIQSFVKFLGHNDGHRVYQKAFLDELHHHFRNVAFIKQVQKQCEQARVCFVSDFFQVQAPWLKEVEDFTVISEVDPGWILRIYSAGIRFTRRLKWIVGYFVFPVVVLLRIKKIHQASEEKKNIPFGIRIYRDDLAFKCPNRSIDFLLDGESLTKDNTLFCIETPIAAHYRDELAKRGCRSYDFPFGLQSVSKVFFKNIVVGKFLTWWGRQLFRAVVTPPWVIKVTLKNWLTYLPWTNFLKQYQMKHYIVYNDFGEQHILRNILLKRQNIRTWFYLHSRHLDDLFARDEEDLKFKHSPFVYMSYDHFIRWSDNMKSFYEPHQIREFCDLGCFWSEHIRQVAESPCFEMIKQSYLQKIKPKVTRIVSVFDTSFGYSDGDVFTFEGMKKFFDDVICMLNEFKDVMVIFKEKNRREDVLAQFPDMELYFKRLEKHPRCVCAGTFSDAAEINAVSDLNLSVAFTSMAMEALGARKKAVFYDPLGRFPGTYFDRFPKLSAHTYEELKEYIQYWLYDVTPAETKRWFDQYVVGEIDAYADGRAITRFRQLLNESKL
jgi:polysaccharide biosynthesis PFTS motif protein